MLDVLWFIPLIYFFPRFFLQTDLTDMKGLIFNIKRYAIHDGPGIRVTFFMKGCPLACWWCHNPEGISSGIQEIDRTDRIGSKEFTVKETVGKYYSSTELLDIAKKDLVFIEESGGGITFSGGEPLLQPGFLLESLKVFRNEGMHTTIDTSGFADREVIDSILPYTELFLFDIKHMDPGKHKQYTGVSNSLILENYKYIIGKGKKVIIRIPVIPGINDGDEDIRAFRDFIDEEAGGNVSRIDLLAYHKIGSSKYKRFKLDYKMQGVEQPSSERMNELKGYFEETGIKVKIGG